MKHCKRRLLEMLAVISLLWGNGALADYGLYHYSILDGPSTDTDGDYYLDWYVIPTDYMAEYDTVQIVYLQTRMNDTGSWTLVQQWNNLSIYAAYDSVHLTGRPVGKHNYHMITVTYGPYTGYQILNDFWDVTVTAPPPPPTPGVTTPPVEMTSGFAAGTTPYGMDVAINGDAVVNVPLELIPGVAGFKPDLYVTYGSGRGVQRYEQSLPEDTLGYGFRVAGLSQIRRCVVGQSGSASIQLNTSDSICLDGMPLVLVSGTHWSPGAIYRTQMETYSRIEIKGSSGALWFEVTGIDGARLEYGNDTGNGSRVDRAGGTDFQWSISKASSADTVPNVITYTYHHNAAKGINYPLSIDYDNAHVTFGYSLRTDAEPMSIASGTSQEQALSLHTITVLMNAAKVREYHLFHETDADGNLRLKKLQQCGFDTSGTAYYCLKPLQFSWGKPTPTMPGVKIYLTALTDGLGASHAFTYGTVIQGGSNTFILANGDTPFGAPTAPAGTAPLSGGSGDALRHVVTQMQQDNGIGGSRTMNYAYLGTGLRSTDNWGFLGFFAQRVHDAGSGVYTYAQYRQDYPFFGRVARVQQYYGVHNSGSMLTRSETGYSASTTVTGAVYPYASHYANFLYEDNQLLGVSHAATALSFSAGLITQAVTVTTTATGHSASGGSGVWGGVPVTYSFSGEKRTERTTAGFTNSTSPWLIGFTHELKTERWAGPISGAGIEQKSVFTPKTGTVRVVEFTRFPDDILLKLRTVHTIDDRGRITGTSTEGTVGGTLSTRSSTATSFAADRYATQLTNPLLQTTSLGSCDLRFGQHCSMTRPNGEQLNNQRDPFGRVVSATDSSGVTTYTSYIVDGVTVIEGATAAYRVDSDSITTPATRTYYDKLGRVIRVQTQSFGSASIYNTQDTKYDALGRVQKASVPYLSTGSAPGYVEYGYDVRNRVISVTYPQGSSTASTSTAYGAAANQVVVTITEVVKNSAGTSTVKTPVKQNTYDILGQLVKTIDAYNTAQASTVQYTYNALGLMASSLVNGSVATSMQYDAAGNRTQLIDPNAGTTVSTYTPFGEVRTVTDAASQVTTFTYDKLGRLTQRVNVDGTSTWVWDTATNGTGQLASRSTSAGFSETYAYNSAKKLSSVTTNITPIGGGSPSSFVTSQTYDSYGRPLGTTYPSMYVSRHYNSQGYLYQLQNGGNVLQTFNSVDAFGNVTQETYGNGVVTTRQTDAKTGRLLGIETKQGGAWIQDNDYAWQSNSILESRSNTSNGIVRTEAFGHDLHNRLVSAVTTNSTGSPPRTLAYEYDALGNIQEQTTTASGDPDVEDYVYGSSRPHAVTRATIGGVPVDFTYNANGAITKYDIYATSTDKYIEYNAANQPTKIVVGTSLSDATPQARDEFRYDTDGKRVYKRSVWQDGSVTRQEEIFYVGDYEQATYVNDPSSIQMMLKTRIGPNIMYVVGINSSSQVVQELQYAHRDHLGSIEKVTTQTGAETQLLGYEPFGVRKSISWLNNITASERGELLTQRLIYLDFPPDVAIRIIEPFEAEGFTGHEHLDRTGFIHMNGRVYDPMLGRFLSPDPFVQMPTNSQSWNRYSYAMNTPLSRIDPSGYVSFAGRCARSGKPAMSAQDCPPGDHIIWGEVDMSDEDIPGITVSGRPYVPGLPGIFVIPGYTDSYDYSGLVGVYSGGGGGYINRDPVILTNSNTNRDAAGAELTQEEECPSPRTRQEMAAYRAKILAHVKSVNASNSSNELVENIGIGAVGGGVVVGIAGGVWGGYYGTIEAAAHAKHFPLVTRAVFGTMAIGEGAGAGAVAGGTVGFAWGALAGGILGAIATPVINMFSREPESVLAREIKRYNKRCPGVLLPETLIDLN